MAGPKGRWKVPRVDVATFEAMHLHAGGPVLLACLNDEQADTGQKKALLELVRDEQDLRVVRADQGNLHAFQTRYRLLGTPTYVLFFGGKERERMLGMTDASRLKHFVSHALDSAEEHGLQS